MLHWLFHFFGLDDGSGAWYLFWSGPVGDAALLGGIFAGARLINCHTHGCWRLARYHVVDTPYKTCRKHHPIVPDDKRAVTQAHIHETRKATGRPMPPKCPPQGADHGTGP